MPISFWSILVLAILSGYFLLSIVAGVIARKRLRPGFYEFYVAGGTLMWFTVTMSYMASYMEAWEFVGMPAVIVSEGYEWWVMEMIFYLTFVAFWWFVGLRIYKLGKINQSVTPVDLIACRAGGFDRFMRILLTIMIAYATILYIGMIYIPAAGVLTAITGGEIPYHTFLIIFVAFILIYIALGGMRAVAYSDIIAGITFIVAFIALVYSVYIYWGGFTELAWTAYKSDIGEQIFTRSQPIQYFLTMLTFYGLSWLFIPHLIVRIFSAKDFRGVVIGGLGANLGFFLGAFISPLFLGLSLAGYYGGGLAELEVTVVEEYVPRLYLDWFGVTPLMVLLLLGLIAITRSTVDSMLLLTSSTIDYDVLDRSLKIKISEKARTWITRSILILVALLSITVALYPEAPMVIIGFQFTWPAYAVIAWPTMLMIFWKRVNKYGALAAYLGGFLSLIFFTYIIYPEAPHNPFGVWEGTLPSVTALLLMIIVSLLTPPPKTEHINRVYGIRM